MSKPGCLLSIYQHYVPVTLGTAMQDSLVLKKELADLNIIKKRVALPDFLTLYRTMSGIFDEWTPRELAALRRGLTWLGASQPQESDDDELDEYRLGKSSANASDGNREQSNSPPSKESFKN